MVNVQVDRIVHNLKNIIWGDDAAERGGFEEILEKAYIFPINLPLKRLKENIEDGLSSSITIDERAEVSIFKKTLVMRRELEMLLSKSKSDDKRRNYIAKWIVEVWGGIPSGKDENSLNKCIDQADKIDESNKTQFEFERIASWSKYLAFKNPEKYAIYDARVIYSLNWLLFQSESTSYFPFLSGRNSVMELLNYQIYLFLGKEGSHVKDVQAALEDDIQKRRNPKAPNLMKPESTTKSYFSNKLKNKRSLFVSEKDAFSKYCELLQDISKQIFPNDDKERLTKTEMLLFSIADAEIADAILKHISTLVVGKPNITD